MLEYATTGSYHTSYQYHLYIFIVIVISISAGGFGGLLEVEECARGR